MASVTQDMGAVLRLLCRCVSLLPDPRRGAGGTGGAAGVNGGMDHSSNNNNSSQAAAGGDSGTAQQDQAVVDASVATLEDCLRLAGVALAARAPVGQRAGEGAARALDATILLMLAAVGAFCSWLHNWFAALGLHAGASISSTEALQASPSAAAAARIAEFIIETVTKTFAAGSAQAVVTPVRRDRRGPASPPFGQMVVDAAADVLLAFVHIGRPHPALLANIPAVQTMVGPSAEWRRDHLPLLASQGGDVTLWVALSHAVLLPLTVTTSSGATVRSPTRKSQPQQPQQQQQKTAQEQECTARYHVFISPLVEPVLSMASATKSPDASEAHARLQDLSVTSSLCRYLRILAAVTHSLSTESHTLRRVLYSTALATVLPAALELLPVYHRASLGVSSASSNLNNTGGIEGGTGSPFCAALSSTPRSHPLPGSAQRQAVAGDASSVTDAILELLLAAFDSMKSEMGFAFIEATVRSVMTMLQQDAPSQASSSTTPGAAGMPTPGTPSSSGAQYGGGPLFSPADGTPLTPHAVPGMARLAGPQPSSKLASPPFLALLRAVLEESTSKLDGLVAPILSLCLDTIYPLLLPALASVSPPQASPGVASHKASTPRAAGHTPRSGGGAGSAFAIGHSPLGGLGGFGGGGGGGDSDKRLRAVAGDDGLMEFTLLLVKALQCKWRLISSNDAGKSQGARVISLLADVLRSAAGPSVQREALGGLLALDRQLRLFGSEVFKAVRDSVQYALVDALVAKRHEYLQEEMGRAVFAIASVDFHHFFQSFLPLFSQQVKGLVPAQQLALVASFPSSLSDVDMPTFCRNLGHFANDVRHYMQKSSMTPPPHIAAMMHRLAQAGPGGSPHLGASPAHAHTPHTLTPQVHTPQSHTPQAHTPNHGLSPSPSQVFNAGAYCNSPHVASADAGTPFGALIQGQLPTTPHALSNVNSPTTNAGLTSAFQ
eukprot:jgi/Mesvir1/27635/Mv07365-RA.3